MQTTTQGLKPIQLSLIAGLFSVALVAGAAPVDLSKLPPASTQTGVTYDKNIHPLFEASCVRCHGAERPKGGLRLDSRDGVLKGSKERKVVIPGDSEKSPLVIAVARLDPENAMPPKPRPPKHHEGPGGAAGSTNATAPAPAPKPIGPPPKPLTPEEVGLVRAWIDQGAH